MLLRFASIKDRAAGPIGIIHQAEGLAALNDGRRVIDCACLWALIERAHEEKYVFRRRYSVA